MTRSTPSRRYPSHLELFKQCRRRYFLKVVERRKAKEPLSPALEKGRVAHEVLKICGTDLKESACLPADLRTLVAARLPSDRYPTIAAWEADVAEVVGWVKYGLSYLDPYATVLGVELFIDRTFRPDDGGAPIPLGVVLDIILLRTDDTGEQFIEVIDYKTGRNIEESSLAPVMARFVLKPLIGKHLPGDGFAPVVYTSLYLAKRLPRSQELTLPSCLEAWEEVKRTVAQIEAEDVWAPMPTPLCQWCPFNGDGCNPTLAEEEDDGLW